jgi:hypothetical protein
MGLHLYFISKVKITSHAIGVHLSLNTDDTIWYRYEYIQQSAPLMIANI